MNDKTVVRGPMFAKATAIVHVDTAKIASLMVQFTGLMKMVQYKIKLEDSPILLEVESLRWTHQRVSKAKASSDHIA
jgi:ABC-type uncharacterized transport system ATPase subunit